MQRADNLPGAEPTTTRVWPRAVSGSWLHRVPASALAALLFAVLTYAALGSTLWSREFVLSNADRDLALQFLHWRKFGFDELRTGHLALWNPHIYCGSPFFGGFQSALLYPPNWLYLFLPLAVAVNLGIGLHVFLAGFSMFLWMRVRGLHALAATFAGVLFMFSGPYFPHIYAGHLSNLCTMVWAPLIFLAIDGWLRHRTPGWLFLGAAAVTMQILAGHPQYVFYTGVAAGLYCVGQLAVTRDRLRAATGLAAFALAAAALSAVQLCEGFHAANESVRNHGTSPFFAAKFSLPPENLLTLLVPDFFGSLTGHDYWGRWFLWEMSVFFGVTGLVLTIYGLVRGPRFQTWLCAGIAAALLVVSLGSSTPLFDFLYRFAPGFDHFRGWSKFTFPAIVLLVTVAATGFDAVLRVGVRAARGALTLACVGLLLAVTALWVARSVASGSRAALRPWHTWMYQLASTNEQFYLGDRINDPAFVRTAALDAARQVGYAAATLLVLAGLLLLSRRRPAALAGILVLACVEMLCFARTGLDRFRVRDVFTTPDSQILGDHSGDCFRVDDENNHDLAMSLGGFDLWGYDPGILRRYAEWIAVSQGQDADDANEGMEIHRLPPVFATLLRARCRLPVDWSPRDGEQPIALDGKRVPPAARLELVSSARVIADRDQELAAIFAPGFDPSHEVVLESAPVPPPSGAATPGTVKLLTETTDSLTIQADLTAPAILLVTDTYSNGWHAHSLLPASAATQREYQVLPADYCLRAIPLSSGHHLLLLSYRPAAFVVGKWISIASLCVYLAALITWWLRRRRAPDASARPAQSVSS